MELSRLLESLVEAARAVGVEVKSGPYRGAFPDGRAARGGMCVLRGRRVIVIDADTPLPDRIAVVAAALATLDLDAVELAPVVRATIGAHRARPLTVGRSAAAQRPLARARRRRDDED